MMLTLSLANFRSLKETSNISIKPITILVGRNSSGKSTVARFLPLLRQSIEARTSVPLLWNGPYVDFGSIQEVSNKTSNSDPEFSIEFRTSRSFRRRLKSAPRKEREPINHVGFSMKLTEQDGRTSISEIFVRANGEDTAHVEVGQNRNIDRILINGRDMSDYVRSQTKIDIRNVVPLISAPAHPSSDIYTNNRNQYTEYISQNVRRILKRRLHGRFERETLDDLSRRIYFASKSKFGTELYQIGKNFQTWKTMVNRFQEGNEAEEFEQLRSLAFLREIPEILLAIEYELSALISGTGYIAPTRSTGERYHRIQELQVEELDPTGSNLAMFLQSLSEKDKKEFSEWVEHYLGYAVNARMIPGHVKVMLTEEGSKHEYNITDMGFGLSQVLPVAVQIWAYKQTAYKRRRRNMLVIEQPELHLHPAYQARLADLLVGAHGEVMIREKERSSLSLVVETHSEHLLARLGNLVRQGELRHDDVAIYIFDKPGPDEPTEVSSSGFDEEGDLVDWPFGFFSW